MVGYIFVVSFIEVGRVLNVAPQGLEEGSEDGGVSVSVITSADGSHHAGNLDIINAVSCGLDNRSLLDFTTANEGHLVEVRGKRGETGVVAKGPNVGQNQMAKRVIVEVNRGNRDSKRGSDVSEDEHDWLEYGARDVVRESCRLVMFLIFTYLCASDSFLNLLRDLKDGHIVRVPECDGNQIFATFDIDENSDSKLLAMLKRTEG